MLIAALMLTAAVMTRTAGADECLVTEVKLEKQDNGGDAVIIAMTGCPAPKLTGLDGKTPRIVLDFPRGRFEGRHTVNMRVSGHSVLRIRGAKHDKPVDMLRIVLDLTPGKSYAADQTWYQGDGRFLVIIKQQPPAAPEVMTPAAHKN